MTLPHEEVLNRFVGLCWFHYDDEEDHQEADDDEEDIESPEGVEVEVVLTVGGRVGTVCALVVLVDLVHPNTSCNRQKTSKIITKEKLQGVTLKRTQDHKGFETESFLY